MEKIEVKLKSLITVRTLGEFYIKKNGVIIAPRSINDRYAQFRADKNDDIEISCKEEWQVLKKILPNNREENSGISMTEVIDDAELSLYDRMKADILGSVSQYAEDKGMESLEEEDDYEYEDEDNQAPLTQYEFQDMREEYLAMRPEDEHLVEPNEEPSPPTQQENTEKKEKEMTDAPEAAEA